MATTINLSVLANVIKENLDHSIIMNKAFYENDSFESITFKGTTSVVKLYYGYRDGNGQYKMAEKYLSFGPSQEMIMEHAHSGLNFIPFKIEERTTERDIKVYNTYGDSTLGISYKYNEKTTNNPNEMAFSVNAENFVPKNKISDAIMEISILPKLQFEIEGEPIFLAIEFYVHVDDYFHSGNVSYNSMAFINKDYSKAFLKLNCHSCNAHYFTNEGRINEETMNETINKKLETITSIHVENAETDKVTMCSFGFNGRAVKK